MTTKCYSCDAIECSADLRVGTLFEIYIQSMKKMMRLATLILLIFTLSACDFNADNNSDEKPVQYDAKLCQRLLDVSKDNKLSREQLDDLAEQFDLLLTQLTAEVNEIKKLKTQDERCEKLSALNNDPEVIMLGEMFEVLNQPYEQSGYTNEFGENIKKLNVPTRRKAIQSTLIQLSKDCQ